MAKMNLAEVVTEIRNELAVRMEKIERFRQRSDHFSFHSITEKVFGHVHKAVMSNNQLKKERRLAAFSIRS